MPIISRFFGIVIYMYWRDNPPPHFHARYQGQEATVEIERGKVEGLINPRALGLIQEWRQHHLAELAENWHLAQQKCILKRIKALE